MRGIGFVRSYDTNRSIGEASLSFSAFRRFPCQVLGGIIRMEKTVESDWSMCEKRYVSSCTLCSHPICGETVASITFPQKFGTDRDVRIVIRLRFVCLHWYPFGSRLIEQYRLIFLSWFETLFWRQCLQSNGAQTGYGLLSRDAWRILSVLEIVFFASLPFSGG